MHLALRALVGPGALMITLLTAPAAQAGHIPAEYLHGVQPREAGVVACMRGHLPVHPFTDIEGNTHERLIGCLPRYGVANGITATQFGPARAVRRDQMASFLARALTELRVPLPEGQGRFDDVEGNVHRHAVERLAAAGVVNGTGPRTYSPERAVTREQMATFLWRAYVTLNPDQSDYVSRFDYFHDDEASVHQRNINRAYALELVTGTALPWIVGDELGQPDLLQKGLYDPSSSVRRDQMASFMGRLLDAGLFTGPGANQDPYPPFEDVQLKDGWSMSVVGFDNNATEVVQALNPGRPAPAAGHRYVLYRVRATYRASGTATFDGADRLMTRVRGDAGDPRNEFYETAAGSPCGTIPSPLPNDAVGTGGFVEGNVCFHVSNYYVTPHLFDARWGNPAWPHFRGYEDGEPAAPGVPGVPVGATPYAPPLVYEPPA